MCPRDGAARYLELCRQVEECTWALVEAARHKDWDQVASLLTRRGKAMAAIDRCRVSLAGLDTEIAETASAHLRTALELDAELGSILVTEMGMVQEELEQLYRIRDALRGYLRALRVPRRARFIDRQG